MARRGNKFALLVVDVSRNLEEYVLAQERGYEVCFGTIWNKKDIPLYPASNAPRYPRRTLRAGVDAVVEAVRRATIHDAAIYAAEFRMERSTEGSHLLCHWLEPYIAPANRYEKTTSSCFQSGGLEERLRNDGVEQLLIIGYDRDICVYHTAVDAVKSGFDVSTAECCMLTATQEHQDLWQTDAQKFFREKTRVINEQHEVWNFVKDETWRGRAQ